ncbi:MAG: hypothetical protein ABI690_13600 [Chloroflexota bacterium]
MIPTEAWPIIAALCAAAGYWLKRQGDGRTENEKAKRIAAETQLMQAQSESKTKQAEMEERAFIREQYKAQLQINTQLQKFVADKEVKDEANYRVLSNVNKDTNAQLTNVFNAMTRLNTSLLVAIEAIPAKVAAGNTESMKLFAREMAAETGLVIAQQFAIQSLDRELFPFPDPEDPAWREEWIYPITPEPTIHKQPYFADAVKLRKPCSTILSSGERVRLIRNRIKGWVIVDKFAADSHCWGWLPEHTVRIGAAPIGELPA